MWNYNCDKCYEREVHSVLKSVTGVADFMLVIPQPSPPSLESPWTNGSGKEANQCSPAKKDFEAGGSIVCQLPSYCLLVQSPLLCLTLCCWSWWPCFACWQNVGFSGGGPWGDHAGLKGQAYPSLPRLGLCYACSSQELPAAPRPRSPVAPVPWLWAVPVCLRPLAMVTVYRTAWSWLRKVLLLFGHHKAVCSSEEGRIPLTGSESQSWTGRLLIVQLSWRQELLSCVSGSLGAFIYPF